MRLHQLSNDEIQEMARAKFQNIIASSTNNDYSSFSREFSDELKSRITQERFEAQRAEHPLLSSISDDIEFIDCIRRELDIIVLYRLRSTKLAGEFFGSITLEEIDNTIQVTGDCLTLSLTTKSS